MSANAGSVESSSRTYDVHSGQSLTEAIVEAVAEASGRPPLAIPGGTIPDGRAALEPLYHAVDPEALETLCSAPAGEREGDVTVSFSYQGCRVTVHSYGVIRVEPAEPVGN